MQAYGGVLSHGTGVHLVVYETHGEVPRIRKIFDDSGSSIILSRTGFQSD